MGGLSLSLLSPRALSLAVSSSQCVSKSSVKWGWLPERTDKFEKLNPEVQLNSWQVGTPSPPW